MKAGLTSARFMALKMLFVFAFFTVLSPGFTKCDAQAIVGKWKGVSAKNYFGAEYAKQIGKSMEEKTAKETGNSEIAFNADHHFVLTFSPPNSTDVTTMQGTWSTAGDQLKLTMEPKYNPNNTSTTATFTIVGNTLVTIAVFPPASRTVKTMSTSTRL